MGVVSTPQSLLRREFQVNIRGGCPGWCGNSKAR
jgi:hypothetical protein